MAVVRAGTIEPCAICHRAVTSVAMRRPQPARGLVAVISGLLVVIASAMPASAAIAPAEPEVALSFDAKPRYCTRWPSLMSPPRTIRVLRTAATSPAEELVDTVQTVDFSEYVATVMAAEWPEKYPLETIKAGAVATKQFAWYHIKYYRGGVKWKDGVQQCYDVVDSTTDQWYRPEKFGPGTPKWPVEGSKVRTAMDLTWDQSLRKYRVRTGSSRFFLTGYRAGATSVPCGADAGGFKLFHNSARECGTIGLRYREILRKYLKPGLEIVTPGANDVIGTRHGDALAVEQTPGQRTARVFTLGQAAPEPGTHAGVVLSAVDLVDHTSGDLNGDGRQDLAWLTKTGATSGRIDVALSDGVNLVPSGTWWAGETIVPVNGARLLIGDVHGDGRPDVAIFGRGEDATTSRMVVLKRTKYANPSKFSNPVLWWAARQRFEDVASVWLADLSGDGRSDLVVRENLAGGGVRLKTAVTTSPLPGSFPRMGVYKVRWGDRSLVPAKVRMAVGDANRDGRDDVMMLNGSTGRTTVERLQGLKLGGFKRVKLWTAPKKDPIPVTKTRLTAADVDFDGREDFVLFTARSGNTRIRVLRSRYDSVAPGPDRTVRFAWGTLRPL